MTMYKVYCKKYCVTTTNSEITSKQVTIASCATLFSDKSPETNGVIRFVDSLVMANIGKYEYAE